MKRSRSLRPTLVAALAAGALALHGCRGTDASSTPAVRTVAIPGSDVTFELVWIEDGGFWIGRREVTWEEYLVFCDFAERRRAEVDGMARPSRPLDVEPMDHGFGLGRHPVIGVSRNGAETYCRWLGAVTGEEYRLPTETEWTLACAPLVVDPELVVDAQSSQGATAEVGSRGADAHLLFDALGNVAEYVSTPASPDAPKRALSLGGSFRTERAAFVDELGAPRVPRLPFDPAWTLRDSNFPPGVWWVPDGDQLGFRILCAGPGPGAR
ncbi:MAG: SUMF1/EgtB/PvdO family nonheme iron enzyme [Planctomycetota bacterium]